MHYICTPMSKVNTELFIARRMGSDGSSGRAMVRIAAATAAVSVAVMIVAVAVIMGFRAEISEKIAAFSGHARVQSLDYGGAMETDPIETDLGLEADVALTDHFLSLAPYALKGGLLRTNDATQGVVLKGVEADYDLTFFEKCLVDGALPRIGGKTRHKDVLISATVARMLQLSVDDRVEMLFMGNGTGPAGGSDGDSGAYGGDSGSPAGGSGGDLGKNLGGSSGNFGASLPRRDRFRVSGIYSSGLAEMDSRFVLCDIANVRRLNGWNATQITGYEVVIDDIENLDEFESAAWTAIEKYDTSDRRLAVRSVTGDFPQLFDWLATHNVNAAVIITIMIAVALISMISALLIIVLERIRMIGILKTLGMRSGRIRRIFVIRASRILFWGLIWGNLFGIGVSILQQRFGIVRLDSDGYFLSAVPISLSVWWLALLNVGTFVVILALLIFPTAVVGRINPSKSMRYQ